MASHSEDLDAEGLPDLDGALPADPTAHEGLIPPRDHKQAPDDYWHQDSLDERLREEVPDRVRDAEEPPRLQDAETENPESGSDWQVPAGDEGGAPSAEEAAIRVSERAPGALDNPRDSYTGEALDQDGETLEPS
ncbi:MAG TPA: hypothetical protein VET65_12600 [Candidatus Limnocylindrales bacterium]|nr:hypothetical protein [Candidatus Limnocylindrales bacterium]